MVWLSYQLTHEVEKKRGEKRENNRDEGKSESERWEDWFSSHIKLMQDKGERRSSKFREVRNIKRNNSLIRICSLHYSHGLNFKEPIWVNVQVIARTCAYRHTDTMALLLTYVQRYIASILAKRETIWVPINTGINWTSVQSEFVFDASNWYVPSFLYCHLKPWSQLKPLYRLSSTLKHNT